MVPRKDRSRDLGKLHLGALEESGGEIVGRQMIQRMLEGLFDLSAQRLVTIVGPAVCRAGGEGPLNLREELLGGDASRWGRVDSSTWGLVFLRSGASGLVL